MKHKILRKLIVGSLAAVVLLSGCGAQETISMGTGGKPSGIHMSEGAKYQYQSVEPSDIIVEYSGLKPDCSLDKVDGTYLLDSSVYEGDTFGVYLDGEYFGTTIEEYVPYSDIQWAMVDNTEFWSVYGSRATSDVIDTSMIEGKVIYSDGSEMIIEPERVWGTLGGGEVDYKLSVVYRGKVYGVSSPCPWLDWDMSGSSGETADVSGSVVLNPEVSEGTSSSSQASASEGTVDKDFSSYNAFLKSDLYKKIKGLFAASNYDEDNEECQALMNIYGRHPYDLWNYTLYYLETVGGLSSLHKLESVNTLDEFWVVYDEIMSPYGKDSASLKAKKDAEAEELEKTESLRKEASEYMASWYKDNVAYLIDESYEMTYGKFEGKAYEIEVTVVLPDDIPSIPYGFTLRDIGYLANGDNAYLLRFPNDTSRSDWGLPEEVATISYNDWVNWWDTNGERYNEWLDSILD